MMASIRMACRIAGQVQEVVMTQDVDLCFIATTGKSTGHSYQGQSYEGGVST